MADPMQQADTLPPHPDPPTEAEVQAGRERLRRLLGPVPAEWQSIRVDETTGTFGAVQPFITRANLDAVVVRQEPSGTWSVDILLKHVPRGISNAFGTVAGAGAPSPAAAEELARELLSVALVVADANAGHPAPRLEVGKPVDVFSLHGIAVDLSPDILADTAAQLARSSPKAVAVCLRDGLETLPRALATWFPDGVTREALRALDVGSAERLLAFLHVLAACGVRSFPQPPPPVLTRERHVAWCKRRALDYVDLGRLGDALVGLSNDLLKHPLTAGSEAPLAAMRLVRSGTLMTSKRVLAFIESVK